MIGRILVPEGARLPETVAASERRRPTNLDERTLVPAMLPVVPLNGQSTIPANLPLESIAARVVVPRDVNREAYAVVQEPSALPPQPTELDERITVPVGAAPPIIIEPHAGPAPDIVNPDIFLTGNVNFVPEPPKDDAQTAAKWQMYTRVGSVVFHVLFLIGLLSWNKLFPAREPTREEGEIARQKLTYLLPGKFDPEPVRRRRRLRLRNHSRRCRSRKSRRRSRNRSWKCQTRRRLNTVCFCRRVLHRGSRFRSRCDNLLGRARGLSWAVAQFPRRAAKDAARRHTAGWKCSRRTRASISAAT